MTRMVKSRTDVYIACHRTKVAYRIQFVLELKEKYWLEVEG